MISRMSLHNLDCIHLAAPIDESFDAGKCCGPTNFFACKVHVKTLPLATGKVAARARKAGVRICEDCTDADTATRQGAGGSSG